MRTAALITTHNRPIEFARCVAAIKPQVEHIYVLAHVTKETGPGYATDLAETDPDVTVMLCADLNDDVPVPNLYWLWNHGMDRIDLDGPARVAVLNDDAVVSDSWFSALSGAMTFTGAAAASAHHPAMSQRGITRLVFDIEDPIRMNGFAFVTASHRRFADGFWWWYGDNHFDWECRKDSGVVFVGGYPVEHPPNGGTDVSGTLAEIVARDRELFLERWGRLP